MAGDWKYSIYEPAFASELCKLGHQVHAFCCSKYFENSYSKLERVLPMLGPNTLKLNYDFIKTVERYNPCILLIWRGIHVHPLSIKLIKKRRNILVVSYNNDDPFGPKMHGNVPWHHHLMWRWYLASLQIVDHVLVYRKINVGEALSAGAKKVNVLMPYFIPELHHPACLSKSEISKYMCDAVFVGHYEPDGREAYLKALVHAGLHVRLFGGKSWTSEILGECADYFGPIREAHGEEYAKALSGARMCLCFLSRLNRDTYTRRCFEIPACGSLLVSERTEDLRKFFKEDEEAIFFSSVEELVEKARWLKANPDVADRIAAAGMRRVHADGHSVTSRARQFLELIGRADGGWSGYDRV